MSWLVAGLIIFFAVHSISIVNEPWRDRMVAKMGEAPWKGIYSVVATIGFFLFIWGYGLARQESAIIYISVPWLMHLSMLLLIPVFPLLLATYFPGSIRAFVRHPMLLATILWAFAHLLVNGRLTDILLFGSFLVWSGLDLFSMRQRVQRPVPSAPASRFNDLITLVLGLALYSMFVVWLHSMLIGVPLVALTP
jgi:uncharacterized membrane protein